MPPEDSLELFPQPSAPAFDPRAPLADRMRPRSLDEVAGQQQLVGPGGPLRALAASGELPSLLLWGPPGCGKTTLARLLAAGADMHLESLSAVMAGVKEIRASVERARRERRGGRRTALPRQQTLQAMIVPATTQRKFRRTSGIVWCGRPKRNS